MKTFVQALDLKDDSELIAEYKRLHQAVWPEVIRSLRAVGVLDMQIYNVANRLFMILTTVDDYQPEASFQEYLALDSSCVRWEKLMDRFQQALPGAADGQKWVPMENCFNMKDYP